MWGAFFIYNKTVHCMSTAIPLCWTSWKHWTQGTLWPKAEFDSRWIITTTTNSIHIFIYESIFHYFQKQKKCYWYNLIKYALNCLESIHMTLQLDTFESGIFCTGQCFLRSRWCHYIYSIKKALETTLPLCFVNSGWDFLGTLLLQCWGGRHANVSPWKKTHCPRDCIFRGRPNFSKSQEG